MLYQLSYASNLGLRLVPEPHQSSGPLLITGTILKDTIAGG